MAVLLNRTGPRVVHLHHSRAQHRLLPPKLQPTHSKHRYLPRPCSVLVLQVPHPMLLLVTSAPPGHRWHRGSPLWRVFRGGSNPRGVPRGRHPDDPLVADLVQRRRSGRTRPNERRPGDGRRADRITRTDHPRCDDASRGTSSGDLVLLHVGGGSPPPDARISMSWSSSRTGSPALGIAST